MHIEDLQLCLEIPIAEIMTQSPPASRRPKELPFYEAPDHVPTISNIIREARASLGRDQLRPINTRRPDTPQDGQRNLFGEQSNRDASNRPPSAFSLGSRHFDSDSRPPSGIRLKPLEHKPQVLTVDHDSVAPKPPADPNRPIRKSGSRTRLLQHSTSIDESASRNRAGSLQDVAAAGAGNTSPQAIDAPRRVHSGPRERTRHLLEERGEGDGSESIPRTESRSGRPAEGERIESGYSSDVRENSAGSQRGGSAGRAGSGSAGKREEETPEEAHFYNTKIGPIVESMAQLGKEKNADKLIEQTNRLYEVLELADLLGRSCKRRSTILKTVYKLLDVDNPKLLLALASLILALKVSGNNLANVCKLIFKVSKDEKNDDIFTEGTVLENILETARNTDPSLNTDALTYCIGAVKFLTSSGTIGRTLVKLGGVEALASLLHTVNKINAECGKPSEQLGNILVQLTVSLRNLADISATRQQFMAHEVIAGLCQVLDFYVADPDLMLNVSRVFSKLTQHADCCMVITKHSAHFRCLMNVLKTHCKKEDLVVRVSFILGNLTAKNDHARTLLFQQSRCLETLLSVFKYYLEKDSRVNSKQGEASGDTNSKANKLEDVLIKVIRVIANLSINEEIGPMIAASEQCVKLLLQILDSKDIELSEELVLNTMATINNLSYYNTKNSAITSKQLQVAESLFKFLHVNNMNGLAEATRVFGNLSRERPVRDFLAENKVLEMMVALLDSGSREVVYTAVGVLINLMADEEKRPILKKEAGVKKLTDVLRDFGREDWVLASMVCQILCNYSGRITSSNSCFGEEESKELGDLLEEFLDEECALHVSQSLDLEDEVKDLMEDDWRTEFYPVANRLLERIEKHQSNFEPLDDPT